jgi:hypothetical protein
MLFGRFPEAFGNLTALTSLNLDENFFYGSIPASIGNLKSLTVFRAQVNQLNGTLPTNIGDLTALKELRLGDNYLSGTIPSTIGNLTSLTYLDLGMNNLGGFIPSSIGNLRSLIHCDLSWNQLRGEIPSSIGNLKALTYLKLGMNRLGSEPRNPYFFYSIPSAIGNLSSLVYLHLAYNNLSSSIPSTIGGLTAVKELYLNDNRLSGPLPSTMSSLAALTSLSLQNNRFTGDTRALAGVNPKAVLRLYPNAFTATYAPPQVDAANLDPTMLASLLAADRSLKKRQMTSIGLQGEYNITTYCPLDGGITKEIVLGCIYGLQAYCTGGSPMSKCHEYYNQVFRNSKRYNQMGVNCPPWRAGPVAPSCAADITSIGTALKQAQVTDTSIQDTDINFPRSVNENLFKSPKWSPCSTGAYPNLVCAPRS